MTAAETLRRAAAHVAHLNRAATTAEDGWTYYDLPDGRAELCTGPMPDGYRTGAACTWEEGDDGARLSAEDATLICTMRAVAAVLGPALQAAAADQGNITPQMHRLARVVLGEEPGL